MGKIGLAIENRKSAKIRKKAVEQLETKKPELKALSEELLAMSKWPREKLMDAVEREYEILQQVLKMLDWWYILTVDQLDCLRSFSNTEPYIKYIDDGGETYVEVASVVKTWPYPPEGMKVKSEIFGETEVGYFQRLSCDYYAKLQLKNWAKGLSNYQAIK